MVEFREDYKDIMKDWLEYKRSIKKTYKNDLSIDRCYKNLLKMSNGDPAIAQEIVDQSIGNGWIGLFPLRRRINNDATNTVDGILEMMISMEDIKDDMRKEAYKAKYHFAASKLLKIARSEAFARQAIQIYSKLSKCPNVWNLWNVINDFDYILTYLEKKKTKEIDKNYTLANMVEDEINAN